VTRLQSANVDSVDSVDSVDKHTYIGRVLYILLWYCVGITKVLLCECYYML